MSEDRVFIKFFIGAERKTWKWWYEVARLAFLAGGNLLLAGGLAYMAFDQRVAFDQRAWIGIPFFSISFFGGILFSAFMVWDIFGVSPECYISIYRGRKVVVMSSIPRLLTVVSNLGVHSIAAFMLTLSLAGNDGHLVFDRFFWIMVFPLLLMSLAAVSGVWMGWPRVILRSDAVVIHYKTWETIIPWEKVVKDSSGQNFRIKVAAQVRAERRFRILFGLNIPTPLIQVPNNIDIHSLFEHWFLINQWGYASRIVDFYLANAEARERIGTRESLREIRDEELRTRPYLLLPDMDERVNCPEGCQCCPVSFKWDNQDDTFYSYIF
ncbi:hypothetical protein [Austwickia chelonae]|uniref:hypothetical protein n=1 Tax=Austwickia chelonae TaxID=100225 RepID=UPI000E26C419|nr:hypothetical protein [Austwickia chelonae]